MRIRGSQAADMGRNNHIRRIPQLIIRRQGLRIRNIQRRAPKTLSYLAVRGFGVEMVGVESGDEVWLVEDLASGDVGDEGVARGEDGEFGCGEEVCGFFCEGYADEEEVDVLAEEVVEGFGVEAAVPGAWDCAVWIARSGDYKTCVFFAGGGGARRGRVGYHVHSHGLRNTRDLAADGAVS